MGNSKIQIQQLYNQGYKCIKYEEDTHGKLIIYLKNFEIEKTHTLYYDSREDIEEIKDYINLN